jgi:hypothetical protein
MMAQDNEGSLKNMKSSIVYSQRSHSREGEGKLKSEVIVKFSSLNISKALLERGLKISMCAKDLQAEISGAHAQISGVIFTPEFLVPT